MKLYQVIGYSFDADQHCIVCAEGHFGPAVLYPDTTCTDSEGNPVHPIFAGDDGASEEVCGDCGGRLMPD